MSDPDTWEKRLQSWSPRQPSDKIARTLFETRASDRPVPTVVERPSWRGVEIWHWLTPVAACCFTVVVLCSGAGRQNERFPSSDHATYFATLMVNAASSNISSQTFALSKADENIEWNVWPHATLPTTNFSYAQNGLRPVSNSVNGIYR
jgi:hypothetical protein